MNEPPLTLEDIQGVFAAGIAPILASTQRIENILKDFSKDSTDLALLTLECDSSPNHSCVNASKDCAPTSNGTGSKANEDGSIDINKIELVSDNRMFSSTECEPDQRLEPGFAKQRRPSMTFSDKQPSKGGPRTKHAHSKVEVIVDQMIIQHEMAAMGVSAKGGMLNFERVSMDKVLQMVEWWGNIEEPIRTGCISHLVGSSFFETLTMSVIVLNSVFVAYMADFEMKHLGSIKPTAHRTFELCFTTFFFLELVLRIFVHRAHFFVNDEMTWNVFDLVIVSLSILDQVVTAMLESGGGGGNVGFMRMLRLMKLAKIFRAVRTMRFFKDLLVMLESFKRSFLSVFWSFILLSFMLYIFSLVFMQALADHLQLEGSTDLQFQSDVRTHFGSLGVSMLTLYMSVTGGNDWVVYYDVVKRTGPLYAAVFLGFTYYFMFALFNILTGILVEKACSAAAPDRNDLVLQEHRKAKEDADELWRMCSILDPSSNGKITRSELQTMLGNRVFLSYMASLGLDVADADGFFSTVAGTTDDCEVSIEQFVDGCVNMRGTATSVDMHRQLLEGEMLSKRFDSFERKNHEAMERMELRCRQMMNILQRQTAAKKPSKLSSFGL